MASDLSIGSFCHKNKNKSSVASVTQWHISGHVHQVKVTTTFSTVTLPK